MSEQVLFLISALNVYKNHDHHIKVWDLIVKARMSLERARRSPSLFHTILTTTKPLSGNKL